MPPAPPICVCWRAIRSVFLPAPLKRIQDAMTGPVADKYNEYRNDQLADLWAQVTLQSIGIEAPKTKEPL